MNLTGDEKIAVTIGVVIVIVFFALYGIFFTEVEDVTSGDLITDDFGEVSEGEGFEINDTEIGTGETVDVGDTVVVHYTGKLPDGTVFDSSLGGEPFVFTVGEGQVIEGWERGLVGMREGGVRRLTISPGLAYGDREVGPIPADSTLVFEIELLEIE